MVRTTCRIAGDPLEDLFTLGDIKVSDFVKDNSDSLLSSELKLCLSKKSGLVQLSETTDFDTMYKNYWYHSGINESMKRQLKDIVESVKLTTKLNTGDVWLDIGCNDGTLMSYIPNQVNKIGIDPAVNNCQKAKDHGTVVEAYFSKDSYPLNKKAKVITSIAMFYDLEDPIKFCNDIYEVLDDNGVWVVQLSYLPLMLDQLAFDNICHEHLEYYSLASLEYLLAKTNFKVVDFSVNDTNGGSCRVFIRKNIADDTKFATAPYRDVCNYRISCARTHEATLNLNSIEPYLKFFKQIEDLKSRTTNFIKDAVTKGKKVWGYGASTKGNTLLQYFGLGPDLIEAIAERSEPKFGLKTVGSDIPIKSEAEMRKAKPDYLLVLPWHFIDQFVEREREFLDNGGAFIVPCPAFTVISS